MKKSKIFHCLLFNVALILFVSVVQAELKVDSVYPNVGEIGKDLSVTLRGSGFDNETRISFSRDTGNRNKIIGWADTPGYANSLSVSESFAFIADSHHGLQIIDINNPKNPFIIGEFDTQGTAYHSKIIDSFAYIADGEAGLQIVDISTPSTPVLIGSCDTSGIAVSVEIQGNIAYVADGMNGLLLIDISLPSSPHLIGMIYTPESAERVALKDGIAYVADGISGLQLIDVSLPERLMLINSIEMPGYCTDLKISGNTLYVIYAYGGLCIYDITNSTAPEQIGTIDLPGFNKEIKIDNDFGYIANKNKGLQILDLSIPVSPVLLASVVTAGAASGVAIQNGHAYLTDYYNGLQVIDISDPADSSIYSSLSTDGYTYDIHLSDNTAYTVDGYRGFKIVDFSNPLSPYLINSIDTPGTAKGIAMSGGYAYVADGDYGLQIINVTDKSAPSIVGALDTDGDAGKVTFSGEYIYLADGDSGLQVININDITNPVIAATLDTQGSARGIAISGTLIFIADYDNGLLIIDISDPVLPFEIGHIDSPGLARSVAISGSYAYLADGYQGLQIIDISNPASPSILSNVKTSGETINVSLFESFAYMSDEYHGIQVIDISNPENPVSIGSVDTPGYAQNIKISGKLGYVADFYAGISILQLPEEVESLDVINDAAVSFMITGPEIVGNYNIRVFNKTDSYELAGALTFLDAGTVSALKQQKAVIVAGSGPYETNSLWHSTQLCTNYAYYSLKSQGYQKENIHYLSEVPSDVDGDGITDVDDNATYQNLKSAILDWASDAGDLLIYMTGHGGNGTFEINGLTNPPEYVTVQELDAWLDLIQQNMSGKVILIYDACMSGSFIDQLEPPAGKERIVITSSSPYENAWFLEKGALSFSYQFWASVILNANLYDSFVVAKNLMANDQTCQINANGDTTPNDKTDQALAQNIIIGRGRIAASSPPSIADISEDQVLQDGSTSSIIQAYNIYGLNPIERVWAVIVTPSLENASSNTPITDLPTIELEDPDGDETYEGVYENFSEYGTYSVNVYAEDSKGLYAVPLQTSVTQTQFSDDPNTEWNKIRDDLWIRAEIHSVEKGLIQGQWQLGGQDTTARGDQVFWGNFYASPNDVTWGSSNNPDLFVKIWVDVTGPIYVDYFHVSVPDITVYTDFNATSTPAADQTHTATLTTRFVEHSFINGQSSFTLQDENGAEPSGYSETASPFGALLINNLRIGAMINTVEKGSIEGVWQSGGQDTTARGDTVIWGHYYADPSLVTWGSPQNPDLFVKIWFDVGGMVNVDFFHVSVPDIEVYSELPADGTYDNSGTTVLGNRFIEHRYQWK